MEAELRAQLLFYLEESERKVVEVWEGLTPEQVWMRPNAHCLAPANQLIHLSGNLRQWVLAKLGGAPDVRERQAEFDARDGKSKAEILADFLAVLNGVKAELASTVSWDKPVEVQGHETSVVGVWIHMVEHLSYHTGQLIFYAKQLKPQAFDFYKNWSLDATD